MADRIGSLRPARPLRRLPGRGITQRAYVLQPVRSRAARIATWTLACIACLVAGGAAVRGYDVHIVATHASCVTATTPTTPASRDDMQDALMRAQLALKQEVASRATVQKSADALAVEVGRLKAQVLFLQGQSHSRR
ncbi:hypothetical protein GCT13_29965 [Paraburkholderia sp. CNPSo 3157]|uniref:Uncharacterized protein n=1 Tax=Paraburkholderia franconis TaxID=2654983 RepID=A0A7X1TJ15_9BURK|nr:hypothetical protein [Paraburkholderia franconis]MPW20983.1 hypothetical protein [Paraburkholderia franconis]